MSPYEQGEKAYKDGEPAESNPYDWYNKDQAYDYTQWARGWGAAFTKARHGLPVDEAEE